MSTFMLKSKPLKFTPISNIFIEKYMPKARGEFIKVYLLMLKYNFTGEIGVNASILA
ncbi:DNA replication protein DnaD, partial [Clostridium perfringens]|nr:DNA replication protein DnaD [Clostridium perfringens]